MGPPLETPLSFIDSAGGTHPLSIHLSPLATATSTPYTANAERQRQPLIPLTRNDNVNVKTLKSTRILGA